MGSWVTVTLDKMTLGSEYNELECRDLQIKREERRLERQLNYEKSALNSNKRKELAEAKEPYLEKREERPDADDDGYTDWSNEYAEIKEDYEAQKLDINDYYDELMSEIEEESKDRETELEEEQTEIEALMEQIKTTKEAEKEGISSDIKDSALKLS